MFNAFANLAILKPISARRDSHLSRVSLLEVTFGHNTVDMS